MPIDQTRKIKFIHIPKNAGSAVFTSLGLMPRSDTHATWFDLHEYKYPSFAIVRDPVDRFLSCINFILTPKSLWHNNYNPHIDKYYVENMSFDEIIAEVSKPYPVSKLKGICWLRQSYFICNNRGKIMVDKLINYRNIESELNIWLTSIGRKKIDLKPVNVSHKFNKVCTKEQANMIYKIYDDDAAIYKSVTSLLY